MFTENLSPELFAAQRQFIQVMEAPRDFIWWAETLVTEETKELRQADEENEGMEQVFKELGDLVYVVAGFYNTMPQYPFEIMTPEKAEEIRKIMDQAQDVTAKISMKYKIPVPFVELAFQAVHTSNMSKLGDDGKPIRREDGKILKGPNYQAPDMAPLVAMHAEFLSNLEEAEG